MLREAVRSWALKDGEPEVISVLTKRGMGPSTVNLLAQGIYGHEPKGANAAIIREELAKRNIRVQDEEAS